MPLEMDDSDEDEESPRPRHRFETPRGPWWKPSTRTGRIFLAVAALAVIGACAAAWFSARHFLERDSRFRIAGTSSIQATGLTQVSRAEMLPVFGEDIGKNIFFVHLSDRRKQLEQIPWVQRATVMRLLPDQIRVSVVERTPVAFVRDGQQIGLVDGDGVLLSMPPAGMTQHHYSFPVVTGVNARDPLAARHARMAVYQRLIADLDSTGQHYSEQISEIDLTDPEDARVLMPEQGADILAHLGDEQFLARYQRYKQHIGDWRQQYPHLAAVDLRYEQQVVLQMAPGFGNSSQAAVNGGEVKPVDGAPPSANSGAKKPSAATPTDNAAKHAVKPSEKPSHKPSAHKPASRAELEKKKREAAHRAEMLRRQKQLNHAAAERQGQ